MNAKLKMMIIVRLSKMINSLINWTFKAMVEAKYKQCPDCFKQFRKISNFSSWIMNLTSQASHQMQLCDILPYEWIRFLQSIDWPQKKTMSCAGRVHKRVYRVTEKNDNDFKSVRCPLSSLYIQLFDFGLLQPSTVWSSDGKNEKKRCELYLH